MPCLSWRALESLVSRVVISSSMSERMVAMASCSAWVHGKNIGSSSSYAFCIPFAVDPVEFGDSWSGRTTPSCSLYENAVAKAFHRSLCPPDHGV
jgi:hypothetical protein